MRVFLCSHLYISLVYNKYNKYIICVLIVQRTFLLYMLLLSAAQAATALGVDIPWPVQYDRAKPPIVPPVPADAVVIVNKVEDNKPAAKDVMHPAGAAESGEGHHDKPATPVRGKA